MKIISIFALLIATMRAAFAGPPHYTVTDLGTLGGLHGASEATAINDSGQIVGLYRTDDGDVPPYPFLWEKGRMRRIGHFQGTAYGINSQGVVVGAKDDEYGDTLGPAFVYSNHQVYLLKTLGGKQGSGKAINDASVVIGEASLSAPPNRADEPSGDYPRPALWQAGQVYDLGKLGVTDVYAINNQGDVAGCVLSNKRGTLPVLLRGRAIKHLPLPRKFYSATPRAVSEKGEVVGGAELNAMPDRDGSRLTHAAAWLNGKMYDLGLLTGRNSAANGVNSAGLIVGNADTKEIGALSTMPLTHAVVWQDRKLYDLDRCIPRHSGWELITASAINSRGQIVGYGYHNHITHAFLLTPITK